MPPFIHPPATSAFPPRSAKSFARAQHWVAELQRHASQRPIMVLVGNKTDLPVEARAVAHEAAAELADRCADGAVRCVMFRAGLFELTPGCKQAAELPTLAGNACLQPPALHAGAC